ncbi:Gfo/Idh/MocA family oxidoreductase [bacterium]|nr:Gfo/Idh/MocA family oxidoreductase [bacterium]
MHKIGFIGCGGIANAHARALASLKGRVEMVAFCDIEEERARWFSQTYTEGKAKVFTDYRKMYDEVKLDIVYICLPPFAHKDDVDIAAEKGIHIFIEKPIALDMETANRMVKAVEKGKVKSQVGFMFRFGDAVEEVKNMLSTYGPVGLMMGRYMCNSLHSAWWRDKTKSGGQIVEQIIHIFDLIRYFMGEPETVYARWNNIFHRDVHDYTVEDVSGTVITFKDGGIATVSATNGAIPGKWIAQLDLIAKGITANFIDANHAVIYQTLMPWEKKVEVSSNKDIYLAETLDLLDAIENDREARVPMIEGAKSLQLVLSAATSAEKGEIIKI